MRRKKVLCYTNEKKSTLRVSNLIRGTSEIKPSTLNLEATTEYKENTKRVACLIFTAPAIVLRDNHVLCA